MEKDIMTVMETIEAMAKSKCRKEECRFYDPWNEASYDGCIYGTSVEDKENERACSEKSGDFWKFSEMDFEIA